MIEKREDYESLNSDTYDRVYTREEVDSIKKEMASNSEKGVQKLICEKKMLLSALHELSKIAEKSERLIELAVENPEVAEILLNTYFNESLDEYKRRIGYTEDYYNPDILRKQIEREAENKARKRIIEVEKRNFMKKLMMGETEKTNFENALDYLINNIEGDDYESVFEKAYLISNGESSNNAMLVNQELLGKVMSVNGGRGNSKMNKDERRKKIREEVEEFYRKHKVI